jgi:hypothetical protein
MNTHLHLVQGLEMVQRYLQSLICLPDTVLNYVVLYRHRKVAGSSPDEMDFFSIYLILPAAP